MKFEVILLGLTLLATFVYLADKFVLARRRLSTGGSDPWYVDYSKSFLPILVAVLILRSFVAEPFRIPSGSMMPTLIVGDFVVVNKFAYGLRVPVLGSKIVNIGEPKRGDVVVFRHSSGKDMIKRIVGLPGDLIEFKNEVLYINGKKMDMERVGKKIDPPYSVIHYKEDLAGHQHDIFLHPNVDHSSYYTYNNVIVPDGKYFVSGDNRHNSQDSRMWGFVNDKELIGKAFATWASFDWGNFDFRWKRFGKSIV